MVKWLLEQGIDLNVSEEELSLLGKFIQELPEKALGLGIRVLLAALALFIGLQSIRLLRRIVEKSLAKTNADQGVAQFLDSLIKIGLTSLLILMIAISFGLDAASVMAMLGSAGVAFALAMQGSLSNCAGGVLILLQKPFVIGDYIIEGSRGQEGTVVEIQLFYTKLRTADDVIITLPNGSLANHNITNYTAVETRRMDVTIGISYDADLKLAKEVLMKVLESEERVLTKLDKKVFVKELGDSAVVLNVRCFFLNEDYWDGRAAVLENCKLALDANNISIPYPQMDVHLTDTSR
jgi:small conductance mechanosensitive channel